MNRYNVHPYNNFHTALQLTGIILRITGHTIASISFNMSKINNFKFMIMPRLHIMDGEMVDQSTGTYFKFEFEHIVN